MKIRSLADVPQCIPILTQWFYQEWHDFDGRGLAAIEAQLRENLNRDRLPITFTAHSNSELVGTVSLDLTDLPPFNHLFPWLASLYVIPKARRTGIGTALVRHALDFASSHSVNTLYLWTAGSTRLYQSCGWQMIRQTTYRSRPVTLMRVSLSITPPGEAPGPKRTKKPRR